MVIKHTSSKGAAPPPPSRRKRGYTTFTRDIVETEKPDINLEGDEVLPPHKKQKRTVTVIDFTQEDSDVEDDKPIFSPAAEHRHKPSAFQDSKNLTCISCSETKSHDSFPLDEQDASSLGGAICRRCWEANSTAERAHEVAKVKEQECSICYDTAPVENFPAVPHAGCARDHTVCISCWERHLHTEIERKEWDKLTCPQDGCGRVMEYGEIAVLDGRFERGIEAILAAKATASYLKQDTSYFACPSATCKSGIFLDDDDQDQGIFTCEACSFSFCLECKVPMHTGVSCEDYQDSIHGDSRRRGEEEKSKALVDGTYKTCPNKKCGSKLELMSGCDHVVCLRCKRKFNWSSVPDPKASIPQAATTSRLSTGMTALIARRRPRPPPPAIDLNRWETMFRESSLDPFATMGSGVEGETRRLELERLRQGRQAREAAAATRSMRVQRPAAATAGALPPTFARRAGNPSGRQARTAFGEEIADRVGSDETVRGSAADRGFAEQMLGPARPERGRRAGNIPLNERLARIRELEARALQERQTRGTVRPSSARRMGDDSEVLGLIARLAGSTRDQQTGGGRARRP